MENQSAPPRARRKHRSLAQELVTELSERIRSGQLKRGDKLPTESAIMEEQGVSRTVVREAISRLQASGLVETRHGIGTFVLDMPSPSGFRIDPATIVTLRDVLLFWSCASAWKWKPPGSLPSAAPTSSWRPCGPPWMR